jgi:hypothetical protein
MVRCKADVEEEEEEDEDFVRPEGLYFEPFPPEQ